MILKGEVIILHESPPYNNAVRAEIWKAQKYVKIPDKMRKNDRSLPVNAQITCYSVSERVLACQHHNQLTGKVAPDFLICCFPLSPCLAGVTPCYYVMALNQCAYLFLNNQASSFLL